VPLTYQLETGEQVEIITGKELTPSRDWLRPSLAYLNTARARAKLRAWFKQQDREHNIATGRSLLEKEFKRLALTSLDYKAVASKVHFESVDDMYAAVGSGDIGPGRVVNAAHTLVELEPNRQIELSPQWQVPKSKATAKGININGVGNLLTQIAKCCQPVPGDAITGYITVGRGVSIHRQDCSQALQLQQQEPERIIEVSWGDKPEQTYPVDILVQAYDRRGLLRDITTLLAAERVNVTAVNTQSNFEDNTATMRLTVQIVGLKALGQLLAKLNRLPNIISVIRQRDGK
jgi:GTP pyrophosphokinase